jgi:hypothetical protein
MRRSKSKTAEFVTFNVFYEDGSQSSHRKVPASEVDGLDGEAPVLAFLEAQDRDIGEKSGRPRAAIKSIERSDR